MKKVLIALEIVVLIVTVTFTFYMRQRFLLEENIHSQLKEEVKGIQDDVDNMNNDINKLTKDISDLRNVKEDSIREYEKWLSRKEELENLLGY
ncbi:MAG: hypothetical protein MSC52_08475 [Solobacterium sp.]|nr:hypothetical protein [Solobacterium sp.]MDY5401571.1 hypothetical protein [Erysipelotrichaceae bacterium]